MTELSRIYGGPTPTTVNHRGYRLCEGCSRGLHTNHTTIGRCACDLCDDTPPTTRST